MITREDEKMTEKHDCDMGKYCNETPVKTREQCLNDRRGHGGANYGMPGGLVSVCLTCHTTYTAEDREKRIEAWGGPGHWIGCKLDKLHEGDCAV